MPRSSERSSTFLSDRGQQIYILAVKQAISFKPPENSQLIHVLKKSFRVDGQEGISDPIGMGGNHLAIQLHLVLSATTVVNNIVRAINKAGVVVDSVVMQQMASAEATLSEDEKELGAAVIDVGGGTVDLAVYKMGSICHTESLPMGGNQITNDIAIGLKTSLAQAERLKCRQADTTFDDSREDELIELIEVSSGQQRLLSRRLLSQIAQARTDEILKSVNPNGQGEEESESMSGVVLTGGGAHLKGFRRRAEEILEMPVRVGLPTNVVSWKHSAAAPENCAVLGLIQYARSIQVDDAVGFSAPETLLTARRSPGRVTSWIRERIG